MKRSILPVLLLTFVFLNTLFAQSPNILILFTDDQRHGTIHAMGNEDIQTPNLDQLASEGVYFSQAHTMGGKSGAICTPSRAMLHTGRYIHGLKSNGSFIPEGHITMPEFFRKQGYETFATGKWHNDKASFVRSYSSGENIYFGGMHFPKDGGHFAPWLHHFDPSGQYPEKDRWQAEGFSSQLYADAAVDFLQQQKDSDQPFYCYVAFTSPHDPRTPPKAFEKLYDPADMELPVNYLPQHPFDNGELRNRDENLLPMPRTEAAIRKELALYYGMISEVDAQIGRILEALEKNGKKENTIIIYAGDNGLAVGSHGLLGKQNLYDHSVRIPMVMAGPGIPKNEVRDGFVYLSDIFPTLTDFVGKEKPESVQAENLRYLLSDNKPVRNVAYYIYRDLQRGIRTTDNWKLLKYLVRGETRTQLFNLNEDPNELYNLADSSTYENRRRELEQLMAETMKQYDDNLDASQPYFGKPVPREPTVADHLGMKGKVIYASGFSEKYKGSGEKALVDGKLGLAEDIFHDWQGFEGNDLDIVIDLNKEQTIHSINMSFLQAQGSWIFLPTQIEYSLSNDGVAFTTISRFSNTLKAVSGAARIKEFKGEYADKKARYVRIIARNLRQCPEWHAGAGGKAWIFTDEVIIR